MRDSLYLLNSINRQMPARPSEQLLKVALFSHCLDIQPRDGIIQPLDYRRKVLAKTFRERRKKGVVPVLVSLAWFLIALCLSIEAAFGQLGSSDVAHSLALGLLLGWLPVLVTATTIDRNPSGAEPLRRELNDFIEDVRWALLTEDSMRLSLGHPRHQSNLAWLRVLRSDEHFRRGFFARFAGQGRIRWHCGVAYPILATMDTAYRAAHGRFWLSQFHKSPNAIIWSPVNDKRPTCLDRRMIWQMLYSFLVVGCTIFGAFILSCEFS
ncbi:MAG: hypothetical protein Q9213_006753 [Squamulea squamosa]